MARPMNKNVRVFEYELPLKVELLEEGGFLATSKDLQGVLAEGETVSEAVANAMDVASAIIEIRRRENIEIPLTLIRKHTSRSYRTTIAVQTLA